MRVDRADGIGHRPAGIGIDAEHDVVAERLAHRLEIRHVAAPAALAGGLQADHLDAEFVDRAPRFGDHHVDVVGKADRPFQWDHRLTASADQLVDRHAERLAHRVMQRDIEHGARRGIAGQAQVEHLGDRFDVEDVPADQVGAIDVGDRGNHAVNGIRNEMAGADRPDLRAADHAVGVDLDEHRLAQQFLGRAGIVAAAGKRPLQPNRKFGDEDLDAIDHACHSSKPPRWWRPWHSTPSTRYPRLFRRAQSSAHWYSRTARSETRRNRSRAGLRSREPEDRNRRRPCHRCPSCSCRPRATSWPWSARI